MAATFVGAAQKVVLQAIAGTENPHSARELAQRIYRRECRPDKDTENVSRTLRRMEATGLVYAAGISPLGARTWALTDAGRAALDLVAAR